MIHPRSATCQAVGRAAIAQARILRLGDDLLQHPLPFGMHGNDDAVGIMPFRLGQQNVAIVFGVIAVRIKPQQPFGPVTELRHGQVHTRRLQPAGVVDQPDARNIGRTAADDVAGLIMRSAIGNDNQSVGTGGKGAEAQGAG